MTADWEARETALEAGRSFIVEAPAGSGKTGLLVQRFLRLLSGVDRPESIVAMTFTRKAASEMKERIVQALRDAERPETFALDGYPAKMRRLAAAALARSEQRGWNLLEDPGQLQIQTIDSLCALLTRQMPVISEFGGVGKVVEDARDLYKLAARDTLRALTEGGAAEKDLFRRVALHFDNEIARLESQVASMLQKREQWANLLQETADELVNDFAVLLELARRALRDVFRRAATVDFTEVARAARKALGTPEAPTDLLYSLDYRIEHLLVDEFQDTSRAQYELVKALTEQWSDGDGHTLFVVGDPMQSIYRFREAEIALFLRCWHEKRLGGVRLERIQLTTNFRSTPELIGWVREHIGPTMAVEDGRLGAVKFRESTAVREASGMPARVVPFFDDSGAEEAAEIVRVICATPAERSIAILVRARTHVAAILPALRRAGIAYRAIEIEALKEQQHVMDVLSLTRAILQLGDRTAWLACLRAPWCGLRLADLAALAEDQPERMIFDLLSDPSKLAGLSAEGRGRAGRVQEVLGQALANVGRWPLRALIEKTWFALGGPAVMPEENRRGDVATLFDLLESLEEGGLIRDFSLLNERLELFFARPTVLKCNVDVMTIHQAKGLEFDTVIVPQTARGAHSSERDLLVWTEETDGDGNTRLRMAAQPQKGDKASAYEGISEEIKRKDLEENKRLFYVASTRAKNALHLLGCVKRKAGGGLVKAGSNTFMGLIWSTIEPLYQAALQKRVPVQRSFLDERGESVSGTVLNRLPEGWHMPAFELAVRWQPAWRRAPAAAREITFAWAGDSRRHAGTVVHGLLRRISSEGLERWPASRIGSMQPLVRAELRRLGVPATEEPQTSEQAMRALANTLRSERGRWLLGPHAEARSEYAVSGQLGEEMIAGTADRVFRDEQKRFWIVDFKNSDHAGSKREEFLDEEKRRYTRQLERYAALLRRVTMGPMMLGLYFPLLDAWREWSFEASSGVAG